MLQSFLIGLVAGSRAMTPLAAVAHAARQGRLPTDSPVSRLLNHHAVAAGSAVLAAGELWGDKLRSAPDRIVPAGMIARLVTGGIAGAALAPKGRAMGGAAFGASAAVLAAYLTFGARMAAIRRYGQKATGVVEDAMTLGAAGLVTRSAQHAGARAGRAEALAAPPPPAPQPRAGAARVWFRRPPPAARPHRQPLHPRSG